MVSILLVSYLTFDELDVRYIEKKVHFFVNRERKRHGLKPLRWDSLLSEIARMHSKDMYERKYFSHISPEGKTPEDRIRAWDIKCNYIGENIHFRFSRSMSPFEGDRIALLIVKAWMSSKGHRENILDKRFLREGIGIYIKNDSLFATQLFCN